MSESRTDTRYKQRNAYLKAMGIDVWVEKTLSIPDAISNLEPVVDIQEIQKPQALQNSEAHELKSQPVKLDDVNASSELNSIVNKEAAVVATNIESLDWQALRSVVVECQQCELSQTRSLTVFGAGNQKASLMVIGEAPGAEEDRQGEPFVDKAGHLLTAMLKAMGYQRNEVYITNILKCRPPQNRDPSIEEANACWPYLKRQIELIQPDLILALGRIAAQRLLQSKSTLGRLRGQLHYSEELNVPVIVTYHPAYLLRAPNEKRKAWEDLQMAMKQLETGKGSKV